MCMIFDGFPSRGQARAFATEVRSRFKLKCGVYKNQLESDEEDPFPFELTGPIVLVDRSDLGVEKQVEALVTTYGGSFAGT